MDLGEFLKLLYSARNRFDTVQMEWVYAYDVTMLQEIFDNQNDESRTLLKAVDSKRVILPGDHANFSFVHQKLLLHKQHFLRYERRVDEGEPTIRIIADKRDWNITSSNRNKRYVQYFERDHPINVMDEIIELQISELLDPSFLLSGHDISVIGEKRFLNREVVWAHVSPRKGKDYGRESYFWHSTNEIEMLVDKRRGTLLHYVLKLNASEFAYSAVSKIIFDASISESAFLAGVD